MKPETVDLKCLTLWQPWATAVADGLKTIETRPWKPFNWYRSGIQIKSLGLACTHLGIHASLRMDDAAEGLFPADMVARADMERGRLIAVAYLERVYPYESLEEWERDFEKHRVPVGWFRKPKWAWVLRDIRRITPIPMRGARGLWPWKGDVEYLAA